MFDYVVNTRLTPTIISWTFPFFWKIERTILFKDWNLMSHKKWVNFFAKSYICGVNFIGGAY